MATLTGATMLSGTAGAVTADKLLQQISTYRFGQSREPLTQVEDWVRVNLDSPQNSHAIARVLAGLLEGNATKDCKLFVCRQLAVIGTEDNLPALAPLLLKADTADMARYALQRMQGEKVDAMLLDALDKTEAAAVPGIVNSLGERRIAAAVPALSKRLTGPSKDVAVSSIAALGKIGGPKSAKALAKAKDRVEPSLKRAVSDAQLLIAESFAAEGDAASAKRIYASLADEREEAPVRKAANLGLESLGK